jgi:CBS domain-containing protein
MRQNRVGCLPVVDEGQLVGIVTSFDFLDASAKLFKQQLTAPNVSVTQKPKVTAAASRG